MAGIGRSPGRGLALLVIATVRHGHSMLPLGRKCDVRTTAHGFGPVLEEKPSVVRLRGVISHIVMDKRLLVSKKCWSLPYIIGHEPYLMRIRLARSCTRAVFFKEIAKMLRDRTFEPFSSKDKIDRRRGGGRFVREGDYCHAGYLLLPLAAFSAAAFSAAFFDFSGWSCVACCISAGVTSLVAAARAAGMANACW